MASDNDPIHVRAGALRREAHALLEETGLRDHVRAQLGVVEIVGSMALDLMTWRDIDLYTCIARQQTHHFLDLLPGMARRIESAGHELVRATFNDEYRRPDSPYGAGLYLGLRILTAADSIWKVDLWGWDERTFPAKLQEHRDLAERLADVDRTLLLDIKAAASASPAYRKRVTSMDVYLYAMRGSGSLEDFRRTHLDLGG